MSAVPTTALDLYIEYKEDGVFKYKNFKVPDTINILQSFKTKMTLKFLNVYNQDNVSHTFTLTLNDNYDDTVNFIQGLGSFTLEPNGSLRYSKRLGFQVFTSTGIVNSIDNGKLDSWPMTAVAGNTITLPGTFPASSEIPLIMIDGVPNSKNYKRVGSTIIFTDETTFAGGEELILIYKII